MANDKLQDLIETLKKKGVDTGEKAGQEIVGTARKEADALLAKAKAEATSIVAQAKAESEQQMKRLQSSMEIAASQFISSLKGLIEENLLVLPLKKELKGELSEPAFMKGLITKFVENYAAGSGGDNIQLLLPQAAKDELMNFAIELMAKHYGKGKGGEQLALRLDANDVEFGFQVSKKDGNVRLDFSDDAFLSLFLSFLSPKFRELFKTIKLGDLAKK